MRKFFSTYLPASILLAFLAMVLLTCGGGGGDGGSASTATLTGLSISGQSSMPEYGTATYTATASWDDNTTSTVTPTWSVNSIDAEITPEGMLWCHSIGSDMTVTITATYIFGGITETDTMNVTINHVPVLPFAEDELSGKVFFEENVSEGGGYDSHLYIFNADFSLEQYSYEGPPPPDTPTGTSDYVTGTWSNSPYALVLNIGGQEFHLQRIADSSTEMGIVIYEVTGIGGSLVTWEKTVPVDQAKLPGTYTANDNVTWVFNIDGTGTYTIFGGGNFTWSVDTGILKVVDLTFEGYHPQLYARASSQSDATSYTLLNGALVELTPTDGFYKYYGGYEMTRQ